MSRAARSAFATGLYAIALSLTLFAIPDTILGLFGLPPHKDVFMYVLAMQVLFIGAFYIVSARNEVTDSCARTSRRARLQGPQMGLSNVASASTLDTPARHARSQW